MIPCRHSFPCSSRQWKGRKILPVGKPPGWCSSASLDPSRLKLARIMSNSDQDPGKPYQYNYRAETLPPRSPDPVPRPHMVSIAVSWHSWDYEHKIAYHKSITRKRQKQKSRCLVYGKYYTVNCHAGGALHPQRYRMSSKSAAGQLAGEHSRNKVSQPTINNSPTVGNY